ncbi:hypothetical protein PRUPE_2G180200 [Prunus persica]|uniref:Uncharacterized protein n=1 Tax=Prunus persica TaxID=3760 RepID=A0A251QHL4_PRUPE|nr:hypothetical protein PRUPE_2G180200 [Prunus persica]
MAADIRYQWQSIVLHERDSFIYVTFNILLINLAQQVPAPASTSTQAILAFIVPILLTFIQIKFQPLTSSPFETHHAATMIAIASLLAYSLAVGARLRFPTHSPTYSRFAVRFSGLLSVASLLSLLFSDSWHHVPYMVFFMYLMSECFAWVGMIGRLAYQQVVHRFLCVLFYLFSHHSRVIRTRQLPLTFV